MTEAGALHRGAVVLVVDDNTALLRSVGRLLELEGYQVRVAEDGNEALHQLDTVTPPPDLIISDIAMPVLDGFEFFRAVRRRTEWVNIPFLFLTARDQPPDLKMGYALGADDYLVKPLDQDRLLMIIDNKLTRAKELTQHVTQQQQAVEQAQHSLSMMVAHELRTPLVSITMVSDMLAREIDLMDSVQVHEMLDMMQSGSVRLNRLVEQMVLFVQLQAGTLQADVRKFRRPTAVGVMMERSLQRALGWDYRQRGINFQCDERAPDVTIQAETTALRQALSEVLFNGLMFSPQGGDVKVSQWAMNGATWIAVEDRGPGIAPEFRERIFEPFFQIDRERSEQQGLGLGLTLAKEIIVAHGGSINIEGQPGQGTITTVELPMS
ncbi:MAG: response regulator [Anaerolineae bacterium]|nr:response regulator [Anaerolineae bacterium]